MLYLVVHRVNFAMWLKQKKKAVQKSPREKNVKKIFTLLQRSALLLARLVSEKFFFFLKFNFSRISQLYEIRNCIVCIIPCIHDLKQTNNKKNPKNVHNFGQNIVIFFHYILLGHCACL